MKPVPFVVGLLKSSVVTRLVPRRESFEAAMSAYHCGDLDRCMSALTRHSGPEADALRVRSLVRAGNAKAALSILGSIDFENLSHRYSAELLTLKVVAAISLNDGKTVDESLSEAKARLYGVGSVALSSELAYYEALYHWTQGRYAEAAAFAKKTLSVEPCIPAWMQEDITCYPFSHGYWRARCLELLGMNAASQQDFTAQASFIIEAFEEYDRANCSDTYIEAYMLSNLAVLVRDLQAVDLARFVRARFATIDWNDSLAKHRFNIQEALGWHYSLGGDHLSGLREFRNSAEIAPSVPLKIVAVLDRAFLAAELGEGFSAREELEYACRLSTGVDWERSEDVDRLVLLNLASAVAPYDVMQGRRLLDRYTGLKTPVSPLNVYALDRRPRGLECMAIAAVVRAEYQLDRATMLFKEAYEIWTQVGYAWRAAAAALEVYTLTGDTLYLDVVAREAAARPLSWIARRYASVVLDDPATFVRP